MPGKFLIAADVLQRRWLTATLLWACIVLAIPGQILAEAGQLTVATTEYTSDWNPVSYRSYPAQLVVRLTTERLFEKRCFIGRDQTQPQFANLCQEGTGYESGSIRLLLDQRQCSGLKATDVAFTVQQIDEQPYNDYHTHKLTVSGDQLRVGNPSEPAEWVAKDTFSFPILREGSRGPEFFQESITVGGHGKYNEATNGVFQIANIAERSLKLEPRHGRSPLNEIEFIYYDRFVNMQTTMSGENKPDLVLSWPTTNKNVSPEYTPKKPENLGSFTYVGFNFRTDDKIQKTLIQSQKFRELFTKSLWVLTPVDDRIDFSGRDSEQGIFLGESFDTGSPDAANRPNLKVVETAVEAFISDQNLKRIHEFVVLVSPVFEKLFDRQDRANIASELNEIWQTESAGIRFELRDPAAGAAAFEVEKKRGTTYHMVFDTFIYGRNHLRYMAFIQPENPVNVLGVNIPNLSRKRIRDWMAEGPKGIKAFLDVVARDYPLAVIGHFPRRDLFHRSVILPDDCPPGAVVLPYRSFELWRKSARGATR